MADWNAELYSRFEKERTLPSYDLVRAVEGEPKTVLDIGCGIGNSTQVVAEHFPKKDVLFSLMSQYTPQPDAEGVLRRHVTRSEYRAAVAYMENCGITDGFTQERTSAREEYTPPFDLQGV